ncbi:TetR/AcrR family transcriptional regulator [Nocardioides sp.]|uniref:TetR/AcrR family transcriptional regulator n=1 Tax=Nocardioides sp. TaxID=35761 RepID=UPI002726C086|nr:TetR/AcrR family transcriptional regulator [Nocardioides sp.]MDO9456741.1 TetR family transcriptional regulator [Nocardioides sp.]
MAGPDSVVPGSSPADETRRRLVVAATLGFAEHGVHTASLLEITRQAGQRNRGAVHYHFGSRTGMLVAVLEQHVELLAGREHELLAVAHGRPDTDLASAVEALVRPAVELAELGGQGRAYLMILAQLVEEDPAAMDPEVVSALERMGGYDAYALLERRVPSMPDDLRAERLSLVTAFILRAIADRGRAGEQPTARRQLDLEPFAANLVAMVVGMLTAPGP